MDPTLEQWVKSNSSVVHETEMFKIHELNTITKFEDRKNKVRVVNIGPENDLEMKTLLLLGETGVGKTTFLNTFLNVIFGVDRQDQIRLQLKDQMDQQKASHMSQTEYTTAFTIYHQKGMPFPYNYMVIDTPGLGDTAGQQKDQVNENCLRFYLTNEDHIKHINSVGLVWKSSNQRLDERNKDILSKIKKLLGFDIKAMTDVLLTFSTFDDNSAVSVIHASGMEHNGVFTFENIPLYQCPMKKDKQKMHALMWETMVESQHSFLQELNQRKPQDLKITARLLLTQVKLEDALRRVNALDKSSNFTTEQLEGQQAKLVALEDDSTRVDWDKIDELDTSNEEIFLDDGRHCHYCKECKRTCIPACKENHNTNAYAAVSCNTITGSSTVDFGETVVNTIDKVGQHAAAFATTGTGLAAKIAAVVTTVVTVAAQFGRMILGVIKSVKSEGKTKELHASEGEQDCPVCRHKVKKHEIRDKILAKDANFQQKMDLMKKKKYQEVMGQKVNLQEEIEATQRRIEEYDRLKEKELQQLEETRMEVEQLQTGP